MQLYVSVEIQELVTFESGQVIVREDIEEESVFPKLTGCIYPKMGIPVNPCKRQLDKVRVIMISLMNTAFAPEGSYKEFQVKQVLQQILRFSQRSTVKWNQLSHQDAGSRLQLALNDPIEAAL